MLEKLLVLYDFSTPARRALEWAFRMGELFHSRLEILHAVPPFEVPYPDHVFLPAIRAQIERDTLRLAAMGGSAAPEFEVTVTKGPAAETALGAIEKGLPDLVVMGTHGRTGLTRILVGSMAEETVRKSPAPVLVMRNIGTWPPRSALLPVAFDGSHEESLLLASALRSALPLRIELLHVVSVPASIAYPPEVGLALSSFDEKAAVKNAEAKLRETAAKHPALSPAFHVVSGNPADEICAKAAEIGADLILMPTRSRGAARVLLGSVAQKVVRHAPCHVLTFRPDDA